MILSTKAIVLNFKKYSDSSVIINLFTEEKGKVPVILHGIKGKKQSKLTFFQSLYLLDTIIDFKDSRSIQVLKEYQLSPPLFNIGSSTAKITISIFLSEFLSKSLQEEANDKQTFDFLQTSIKILDEINRGVGLFHLAFLTKLSRYLGFSPSEPNKKFNFYDFKSNNGLIYKPSHNFFITFSEWERINYLQHLPYNKLHTLNLLFVERNKLLDFLVMMYELNAVNFKTIKSFEILKQIFK